jgi:predicted enzyme related to lactoylglutathione lyase
LDGWTHSPVSIFRISARHPARLCSRLVVLKRGYKTRREAAAALRLATGPGATFSAAGSRAEDAAMEVLSSRILLRPTEPARSHAFYGDVLGLGVYREFGSPEHRGVVYFLGNGLLEVSGHAQQPPVGLEMWLQVRNVAREHERLADAGVTVTRPPRREPWGLVEMWIEDPDGVRIALVEVPEDHPLRRDQR